MLRRIALIMMLICTTGLYAGYITPQLQEILDTLHVGRKTAITVHLVARPDLHQFPVKAYGLKIDYLKQFSLDKQRLLKQALNTYGNKVEKLKSFWVFNGLSLKTTKDVILAIASRSEVDFVNGGSLGGIGEPLASGFAPDYWNVPLVRATECWNAGYTGADIVLCIFDTGMLINHVSYGDDPNNWKWRNIINNTEHWEYAWHDPAEQNPHSTPYDYDGHGTHVGGIAVGGDGIPTGGPLPDIGVAPGAKIIACTWLTDEGTIQCIQG